ncbi:hypothetical protein NXW78_02055 [Bacteroides ovatus]|nr:hypothetical protein [Bacteroides ovatus]
MIIYGSNFGIDCSIISVKVGGKEAIVISSKGTKYLLLHAGGELFRRNCRNKDR